MTPLEELEQRIARCEREIRVHTTSIGLLADTVKRLTGRIRRMRELVSQSLKEIVK